MPRPARENFVNAAIALATSVAVQRRIDADPGLLAEREPRANRLRAEHLDELLAQFETARAAFEATRKAKRDAGSAR